MDLLNDQNVQPNLTTKAREDAKTDSATTSPPTTPNPEDMELNEEQLDIISGGGGGLIKE